MQGSKLVTRKSLFAHANFCQKSAIPQAQHIDKDVPIAMILCHSQRPPNLPVEVQLDLEVPILGKHLTSVSFGVGQDDGAEVISDDVGRVNELTTIRTSAETDHLNHGLHICTSDTFVGVSTVVTFLNKAHFYRTVKSRFNESQFNVKSRFKVENLEPNLNFS